MSLANRRDRVRPRGKIGCVNCAASARTILKPSPTVDNVEILRQANAIVGDFDDDAIAIQLAGDVVCPQLPPDGRISRRW